MEKAGIAEEIRFVHRARMFRISALIPGAFVLQQAEIHGKRFSRLRARLCSK
jgi:hypothetical protein